MNTLIFPTRGTGRTPALQAMWDAIEAQAKKEYGSRAVRVEVVHEDGTAIVYHADGRVEDLAEDGDTPGAFPTPSGWSWRTGEAAFDGRRFIITGLRRKLLRALADRAGTVVSDRRLKLAVWNDVRIDLGRLRDVAFQLRGTLRDVFGIGAEHGVVERIEGGYQLVMPSEIARAAA